MERSRISQLYPSSFSFKNFLQKLTKSPEHSYPSTPSTSHSTPTKTKSKEILLEFDKKITKIAIPNEKNKKYTVNFLNYHIQNLLFSEGKKKILCMKTKESNIVIDFFLTKKNNFLYKLPDKITLLPVFEEKKYLITKEKSVDISHFSIGKCIGFGGYSKVFLGRRKDNGELVAIKVIDKQKLLKNEKIINVVNEKNILEIANSKRVTKLFFSFQNAEKIFFVMEFCPGGELFNYLQIYNCFDEETAAYYARNVILAIEELHSKNIIYRDLKPENVLIDSKGEVKLADFGFSRQVSKENNISYSFCGSLDKPSTPTILKKIDKIQFPSDFSTEIKDLILKLTNKNPNKRLCSTKEVLNHPFFIKNKISEPPIQPTFSKKTFQSFSEINPDFDLNLNNSYINYIENIDYNFLNGKEIYCNVLKPRNNFVKIFKNSGDEVH